MSEGVIDDGTYINCTGSFDQMCIRDRDFGIFMPKHLAGQWCVNSNPVTIKFT